MHDRPHGVLLGGNVCMAAIRKHAGGEILTAELLMIPYVRITQLLAASAYAIV
jgi:hypothetical protein